MLSILKNDLKAAMKSGEKGTVLVLRNMISKIRKQEIDTKKELTEADSQKVLMSYAKQLKDSISQFKNAGRTDLYEKEEAELEIVKSYLPQAMSEEEMQIIVKQKVEEAGASSMADMGKVMPLVMKEIAGRGDGKIAQQFVREELSM